MTTYVGYCEKDAVNGMLTVKDRVLIATTDNTFETALEYACVEAARLIDIFMKPYIGWTDANGTVQSTLPMTVPDADIQIICADWAVSIFKRRMMPTEAKITNQLTPEGLGIIEATGWWAQALKKMEQYIRSYCTLAQTIGSTAHNPDIYMRLFKDGVITGKEARKFINDTTEIINKEISITKECKKAYTEEEKHLLEGTEAEPMEKHYLEDITKTLVEGITRTVGETLTKEQRDTIAQTIDKTLTDIITETRTITSIENLTKSLNDTLVQNITKIIGETLTKSLTEDIVRTVDETLSKEQEDIESLVRTEGITITKVLTETDTITKTTADTITKGETLTKLQTDTVHETKTLSDTKTMAETATKTLTDTATITEDALITRNKKNKAFVFVRSKKDDEGYEEE